MRTFLILLAMAGVTGSVLAQGTVSFNNGVTFKAGGDRLVRDAAGAPLVGTQFVAQLYYGPSPDDLRPVTNAPARFRVPTTTAPGTWSGGTRTVPGYGAGDTLWLQVRVWNYALFPTYEDAVAGGGIRAQSCAFTYTIPGGGTPAPEEFWIENFPGIPGPMDCSQGWFLWGVSSDSLSRDLLVLASGQAGIWQAADLGQPSWEPVTNPATPRIPMTNSAEFFLIVRPRPPSGLPKNDPPPDAIGP